MWILRCEDIITLINVIYSNEIVSVLSVLIARVRVFGNSSFPMFFLSFKCRITWPYFALFAFLRNWYATNSSHALLFNSCFLCILLEEALDFLDIACRYVIISCFDLDLTCACYDFWKDCFSCIFGISLYVLQGMFLHIGICISLIFDFVKLLVARSRTLYQLFLCEAFRLVLRIIFK